MRYTYIEEDFLITFCNNPQLTKNFYNIILPETRPPQINNRKTLIREDQSVCPECLHNELIKDYTRAETYCEQCGLVVSMSYPFVGGNRIDNPFSYNYYTEENTYFD